VLEGLAWNGLRLPVCTYQKNFGGGSTVSADVNNVWAIRFQVFHYVVEASRRRYLDLRSFTAALQQNLLDIPEFFVDLEPSAWHRVGSDELDF